MDSYSDLEEYKNATYKEKIGILRMEMIPLLATIKTYTDLIKVYGNANPEELNLWANRITEAVDRLQKLKEILVDTAE